MTSIHPAQRAESDRPNKAAYVAPRIAAAGRVEDLTRGVSARWGEFFVMQDPSLWNPWAKCEGGS